MLLSRTSAPAAALSFLVACAGEPGSGPNENEATGGSGGGGFSPASGGVPSGGDEGGGSGGRLVVPSGGSVAFTGGQPSSGGSWGGTTATGGASSTGGQAGSTGSGGDVSEPMPFFPPKGSSAQCPDPSLRLRFEGPPSLGNQGKVRVFDAAQSAAPIYEVDVAATQVTDTIGGATFRLTRRAVVDENEVIFLLPRAGLEYGHTYYVTVDEGVVRGPSGESIVIGDPDEWRFSVRDAAPSDRARLRLSLDGKGDFCSVQAAVDAAVTGTTVSVGPGAYHGIVYFTNKQDLTLIGDDRASTRIVGVNNDNLNSGTRGRALVGAEDLSGFSLESITIHNQTPQGGSQAEALTLLSCDRCIVRDATIRSLQDTLLWSGRIYAEDSLIEGNVDYIWGSGAVYFNRVEIKTVGRKGYNVQARNGSNGYGYVFVDSRLTAEPGIFGDVLARIDVSAYPSSHVAYIDCEMGPHISEAGWLITGSASTANLRFWEYGSHAPGGAPIDVSQRASGSRQLDASQADQMRDASVVLGGWDPR